jgi:hypothetical protein
MPVIKVKVMQTVFPTPFVDPAVIEVALNTFLSTLPANDVLSVTTGLHTQYGTITTFIGTVVYKE